MFPRKTGINLEWPKMAVSIFFDNFSQKDWYKFGMEKMAIPIIFKQCFSRRLVQIWNGQKWPF